MSKLMPLFVIGLLLSACATQPAVKADYVGQTAYIQESAKRVDSGKAQVFVIAKLDGRSIQNSEMASFSASQGNGNNLTLLLEPYKVPAIPQEFSIVGHHMWAMDGRGLFGAAREVAGSFQFSPEPGRTYLVKGSLSKKISTVWLEDEASGNVIAKFEKEKP